MRAGKCLDKAKRLVAGPRQADYGEIRHNMQVIADGWSWWLKARGILPPKAVITASDAAEMLSLMKKSRKATGRPVEDSYVDDLGYSAIAAQVRK